MSDVDVSDDVVDDEQLTRRASEMAAIEERRMASIG